PLYITRDLTRGGFSLAEAGKILEAHRFVRDLRPLDHPVDHLLFQNRGFDLLHRIRVLEIGLAGFFRIRIGGDQIAQALLYALPVDLEALVLHDLAHQQTQRDTPASGFLELRTWR